MPHFNAEPQVASSQSHLLNLPWWAAEKMGGLGKYHGFAHDFSRWDGPVAEGTDAGVILSGVTGAATITRQALNNIGAGIRLTAQATDSGNAQIEFPGQFGLVANKNLWFYTRVALSAVASADYFMGLGTPANTDFKAGLPAEGLYFHVIASEADGTISFYRRDAGSGTEQSADILTLTDDTYFVVGAHWNGTTLTPYAGTSVTSLTAGTASSSTTNLPDDAADELSFYFGVETNGTSGAADYIDIDWVVCVQEI
jgi:hypothetical protein